MTETITVINADVVERLLLQAVAEKGDRYTYPGVSTESRRLHGQTCHYRWDTSDLDAGLCKPEQVGQAACVAGVVFGYAGILEDLIPEWDSTDDEDYAPNDRFYGGNDQGIEDLVYANAGWALDITPLAAAMLKEAQACQDTGSTWGVSARRGINIRYTRPELSDEVITDATTVTF